MIHFRQGQSRFNFRSAAIIIDEGHILLHTSKNDDFWSLPGGRVEFFEHSDDTLVREIEEETGLKAVVQRHLWYIENFFEYDGNKYHEISNCFLMNLDTPQAIPKDKEFSGVEEDSPLIFKWFPIEDAKQLTIYPEFLKERLSDLPNHLEFIKEDKLQK